MTPEFYPSKKLLRSLLTIFLLLSFVAVSAQQVARSTTYLGNNYGFYEYKPTNYNPNIQYPLIIFLHGMGERGNGTTQLSFVLGQGIPKYIAFDGETMTFTYNGQTSTFLVLSPQLSADYVSWQNVYVDAMLDWAEHHLSVDPKRIYLTGLSLGGGGTWKYVTSSAENAQKFAAIAPICGTCEGVANGWCGLAHANTAVWAFHGQDDPQVGVGCTNSAIDAINACGPTIVPIKTIYPPGPGHFIWDRAYDRSHAEHNPSVFEWFLSHSRDITPPDPCIGNHPPVAIAGNDLTIGDNHYTLNSWGSHDDEGSITYEWSFVNGPNTPTLESTIYATSNVTGLVEGIYTFRLVVKDACNVTAQDDIVVTVDFPDCANNHLPVAIAGNDLTIHENDYMLSSWGSHDDEGSISYEWSFVTGPNTPTLETTIYATSHVVGLIEGVYRFKLIVKDNCNATAEDEIVVTVDLPSANRARTQIAESSITNAFRMYPNPVANRLYIDLDASLTGKLKISVSDISGRTVRTFELQAAALRNGLDLAGLKEGVYMLQIESNGKKYSQKLVKK